MAKAKRAAPALESAPDESERRAVPAWALALVGMLLVAALAWSTKGWWAGAARGDGDDSPTDAGSGAASAPTGTSAPVVPARPRERAPEGMVVVQAAAGAGESAQAPGPAATAGWAWRVRHQVTGIEFLLVEPGSFVMGSPEDEEGRRDDEGPQRTVTLTQPFYLARTEVTQAQWEQAMGSNPSAFPADSDRPVEQVSWDDCQPFLERYGWILPSEAEWEYACRAGTNTRFSSGDSEADLARVAWYSGNSGNARNTTHPVGTKQASPWGFHDMHGNVYEWCRDYYSDSYYGSSPSSDPENLTSTSYRVLRGGSYYYPAQLCRSAIRRRFGPSDRRGLYGLRPRAGVTLP